MRVWPAKLAEVVWKIDRVCKLLTEGTNLETAIHIADLLTFFTDTVQHRSTPTVRGSPILH